MARERLGELGFSVVLYANAALQASLRAVYGVLASLRETGSLSGAGPQLASFQERQKSVDKGFWDELEVRFR